MIYNLTLIKKSMAGIQGIRKSLDGIVVKMIVGIIIIAFVGSIGWSVFFSSTDVNIVAVVDDQEININDLNYEMRVQDYYFQERFGDQDFEIEEEMLQEVSIESLIRKASILNFMSNSSLVVNDNVAYQELSKDESFQEDGKFSLTKFEAMARSQGYIPSTYLKRVKDDIALGFWREGIGGGAFITDKEIQENLRLAEQTRDIDFIRFNFNDILAKAITKPEGVKGFYESNTKLFLTKKLAKIRYIDLSAQSLQKDIEINEQDLQDEYALYLENFDNSIRKTVSHLMINIDEDTSQEQAVSLANDIVQKINDGSSFIDLVKEYSEDEGTKDMGGELGITDGSVFPPEFEQVIATLNEGELSGPVELEESVHLLMLTNIQEPVPDTYEDKKEAILSNIKEDLANDQFVGLLDQASDLTFSLNEIDSIGKELNLLIQSANYFSQDKAPEDLNKTEILKLLFENEEFRNNPTLEIIETGEGRAFIISLDDYKPENIKLFEEVEQEATNYYQAELAQLKLDQLVATVIDSLNQGSEFSSISKDQGAELKSYKDLSRNTSLLSSSVVFDIFNLPRANLAVAHGTSVLENGDAIVYKLKSVNEKQSTITQEDKVAFRDFLTGERKISELSELQLVSQQAAKVIRKY